MKQFLKGKPLLTASYKVVEVDKLWTPLRHQPCDWVGDEEPNKSSLHFLCGFSGLNENTNTTNHLSQKVSFLDNPKSGKSIQFNECSWWWNWIPFLKETSCQASSFPPSQPLHSVYLWAMLVNFTNSLLLWISGCGGIHKEQRCFLIFNQFRCDQA